MAVHKTTDAYRVRSAISCLNSLNKTGALSDTVVAAANTVVGLQNAIAGFISNRTLHREHVVLCRAGVEAVQEMANYGLFTDAAIVGLTTYAGLLALITPSAPAGDDNTRADGSWTYLGNVLSPSIV
jgi:hypothetical protein